MIQIVYCRAYTHDPYTPSRSNKEEELNRMRSQLDLLKKENASLKSRLRGEHQQFGGKLGQQVGQYSGSYGARGGAGRGRGASRGSNGGASMGRSYQFMSLEEKKAATCPDWNRAATPGGSGGCSRAEDNYHCVKDGVRLRHGCSSVKSGGTHICWDRRHTAVAHI